MPSSDLERLARHLRTATTPEEIFGPLPNDPAARQAYLKGAYRRLSKATHPDRFTDAADRALASDAFARLGAWLAAAEVDLTATAAPIEVRAGRCTYQVGERLAEGDLTTVYHCTTDDGTPALLKIARDAADNDLLANEAEALRILAISPATEGFRPYFPILLDAFDYEDGHTAGPRRAHVLARCDGFLSLRDLRVAYPAGLPPEHMGWIWRRLLAALAVVHRTGFVHGAVLPDHILIHPTKRGLVLVDWAYAVPLDAGRPIAAVSTAYQGWYPIEVWRKQPPTPATDLFLAARCMVDLLGGEPLTGALPATVPARLHLFLAGVLRPHPAQRPATADTLLAEFDDLLLALYGPRRYQPLIIPRRAP